MRRNRILAAATAVVMLLSATSLASAMSERGSVIGNFGTIPDNVGHVTGRIKVDIHEPVGTWDDPGFAIFEGNDTVTLRSTRTVTQRVSFWHDANHPAPGLGGSNVAFVEGHECLYWTDQEPFCQDVNHFYIDVLDPTLPDEYRACIWAGGVRTADPCEIPLENDVALGSLTVKVGD